MLLLALLACTLGADPAPDDRPFRIHEVSQGTWAASGWLRAVPPVHLPSPSPDRDQVEVWLGLPEGATAVKAQYDSGATDPKAFTVMTKIAGYDADHGDWFWARFEADGAVTVAGQVPVCFNCHQQVATTSDWVFATPPE